MAPARLGYRLCRPGLSVRCTTAAVGSWTGNDPVSLESWHGMRNSGPIHRWTEPWFPELCQCFSPEARCVSVCRRALYSYQVPMSARSMHVVICAYANVPPTPHTQALDEAAHPLADLVHDEFDQLQAIVPDPQVRSSLCVPFPFFTVYSSLPFVLSCCVTAESRSRSVTQAPALHHTAQGDGYTPITDPATPFACGSVSMALDGATGAIIQFADQQQGLGHTTCSSVRVRPQAMVVPFVAAE